MEIGAIVFGRGDQEAGVSLNDPLAAFLRLVDPSIARREFAS